MTATAHIRGHKVVWDDETWRHVDDGTLPPRWGGMERPCPECGLTADPNGPDPCLGWLPNCESACCGHGVTEGWISRPEANVRLRVQAENMQPNGCASGSSVYENK